jgi:hypothetical protein
VALFVKIPALSMEKQTDIHLHLVLNEDGDDPLVLKSWWSGTVNRERPDLLNVGRATPRLRALCILFLLSKSHESGSFLQDGVLLFRTKIKKGSWICTLANQPHDTSAWVADRFFISGSQLFFSACAGSTHKKSGTKFPYVEFKTQKLSLANLHLYVRSANPSCKQSRLLENEELISFARKLEEKHWRKSAIEMLYPGFAAMSIRAESTGDASAENIKKAENALLVTFAEGVLQAESDSQASLNKIQVDACFQALLENEVETYRRACEPFFAYVGRKSPAANGRGGAGNFNVPQIEVLRINCFKFAETSLVEIHQYLCHEELCNFKLAQMLSQYDFYMDSDRVFEGLLAAKRPITDPYERYYDDPPLLLPEFKIWQQALSWGARNSNRHIAVGALMGHQHGLMDYLDKLCVPLLSPDLHLPNTTETLPRVNLLLREESRLNKGLAQQFCEHPKDFNNALQAAKQVLKAQREFWKALHRRLLDLES